MLGALVGVGLVGLAASARGGRGGGKRAKRYVWIGDEFAKLVDGEEPEIVPPKEAKRIQRVEKAPAIAQIRQVAARFDEEAQVVKLFKEQDYGRMLTLYAKLVEQADEEDVELLLLA